MTENKNKLTYKTALFISAAGNPLITFSVFILFVTFKLFDAQKASWISFLVIGGVALPVTVHSYYKTKKGHYTNFDISDRKQRENFYPFLLGLLSVSSVLLFVTGQPAGFCYGSLVFLAMVAVSYLINYRIKVSMHTSSSFYLALSLLKLSVTGSLLMLAFAFLISYSRLILKRHTLPEVLGGGVLGVAFGALNYWVQLVSAP